MATQDGYYSQRLMPQPHIAQCLRRVFVTLTRVTRPLEPTARTSLGRPRPRKLLPYRRMTLLTCTICLTRSGTRLGLLTKARLGSRISLIPKPPSSVALGGQVITGTWPWPIEPRLEKPGVAKKAKKTSPTIPTVKFKTLRVRGHRLDVALRLAPRAAREERIVLQARSRYQRRSLSVSGLEAHSKLAGGISLIKANFIPDPNSEYNRSSIIRRVRVLNRKQTQNGS